MLHCYLRLLPILYTISVVASNTASAFSQFCLCLGVTTDQIRTPTTKTTHPPSNQPTNPPTQKRTNIYHQTLRTEHPQDQLPVIQTTHLACGRLSGLVLNLMAKHTITNTVNQTCAHMRGAACWAALWPNTTPAMCSSDLTPHQQCAQVTQHQQTYR